MIDWFCIWKETFNNWLSKCPVLLQNPQPTNSPRRRGGGVFSSPQTVAEDQKVNLKWVDFSLRSFACWCWQECQHSKRGGFVPGGGFHTPCVDKANTENVSAVSRVLVHNGPAVCSVVTAAYQASTRVFGVVSFLVQSLWPVVVSLQRWAQTTVYVTGEENPWFLFTPPRAVFADTKSEIFFLLSFCAFLILQAFILQLWKISFTFTFPFLLPSILTVQA